MASKRPFYIHHQLGRLDDTVSFPAITFRSIAYVEDSIWDVENKRKQKTVIVVKSKERGARTKVNACAYSPDGGLIGGGTYSLHRPDPGLMSSSAACTDGALHMWQTKSNFVRPSMTIESAHAKGTETGSLVFSVDGRTVLTRGGDDTVKRKCICCRVPISLLLTSKHSVWDLRSFKKPLAVRSGLATLYPQTNAIFSPDNKYILTGAGAATKGEKGHLVFMKKDTLETVKDLEIDTTPVKVFWHSKINQVCSPLSNRFDV